MNDREQAARGMMSQGIGSLSGRPDTTYRDKMHQVMANAQAAQAGAHEVRITPDDRRTPDDVVQEQQHGVWPSIKRNSTEWVKDIGRGLHDTGKLFYDHGMFSDDILDFFGWQPQDNYYSESMNERFNWDQLMDQVSGKRHPYEGALTGAIMGDREWDQLQMNPLYPPPGPWNEFDPHSKFEEYIDNMNMDEGGSEWSPSEEYLGGTTELAGTTEDKWGQLVRDGVVNPGDTLNPLQIDQLYNLYYEGGAGDMDQFGVV